MYTKGSWKVFRQEFLDYQARGGTKNIRTLLSAAVVEMLDIQGERRQKVLDLSAVTDEDFIETVNDFLSPVSRGSAAKSLNEIKQKGCSHEDFLAYITKFNIEVRNLPDELKPDPEKVVKIFVSKLLPNDLRTMVRDEDCKDLRTAIGIAMDKAETLDDMGYMVAPSDGKGTSKPHDQKQSKSGFAKSDSGKKTGPSRHKSARKLSKAQCYNCWEFGHLAPDCSNPKRPKPEVAHVKRVRQKAKVPEVKRVASAPSVHPASGRVVIANVISKPSKHPHRVVRLMGGNVEGDVSALFDSGSDLNFVHPELAKRFRAAGAKVEAERTSYRTAAGGQLIQATEQMWLTVVLMSGTYQHVHIRTRFVVGDAGENLLLGRLWLEDNGVRDLVATPDRNPIHTDIHGLQYLADDMEYSMKRVSEHETAIGDESLQEKLEVILSKHEGLFDPSSDHRGHASVKPFRIKLKVGHAQEGRLPNVKVRPLSPRQRDIVQEQVKDLLHKGYIR